MGGQGNGASDIAILIGGGERIIHINGLVLRRRDDELGKRGRHGIAILVLKGQFLTEQGADVLEVDIALVGVVKLDK